MNFQRKIQLIAAAVVANGAVMLGVVAPTPAYAANCTAADCQTVNGLKNFMCTQKYGSLGYPAIQVFCSTSSSQWAVVCANGKSVGGTCPV